MNTMTKRTKPPYSRSPQELQWGIAHWLITIFVVIIGLLIIVQLAQYGRIQQCLTSDQHTFEVSGCEDFFK